MSIDTEKIVPCLMKFDFARFRKIYDIGGGDGTLLLCLAKKYPSKEFTIYEKQGMQKIILDKIYDVTNINVEIGDFFESIPKGGDLYIMKCILHDWNDSKCIDILTKCAESMSNDATLLIIEYILPHKFAKDTYSVSSDISMKLLLGGKERTYEDYLVLLEKSGFVAYNRQGKKNSYGYIFAHKKEH